MRDRAAAVTAIEVAFVVLILGVIVSVAVPLTIYARSTGEDARAVMLLGQAETWLQQTVQESGVRQLPNDLVSVLNTRAPADVTFTATSSGSVDVVSVDRRSDTEAILTVLTVDDGTQDRCWALRFGGPPPADPADEVAQPPVLSPARWGTAAVPADTDGSCSAVNVDEGTVMGREGAPSDVGGLPLLP